MKRIITIVLIALSSRLEAQTHEPPDSIPIFAGYGIRVPTGVFRYPPDSIRLNHLEIEIYKLQDDIRRLKDIAKLQQHMMDIMHAQFLELSNLVIKLKH